jgi:hypothetical protein
LVAKIVIITHRDDTFVKPAGFFRRNPGSDYLFFDIAAELGRRGHEIVLRKGLDGPVETADAAILHVDLTVTPAAYLEFARNFRLCMNGAVADISKTAVSGAALREGENWTGPVVAKSNLNCRAFGEVQKNRAAHRRGEAEPYPGVRKYKKYVVYDTLGAVPDKIRRDGNIIVEKFRGELAAKGEYATRFWTFCGPEERCTRWISREPIVKGKSVIRNEPSPVPDELRRIRAELGVDYGKFDFVMTPDGPIVFDVNKTLGRPQNLVKVLEPETQRLADGFEAWMRQGQPATAMRAAAT